MKKLIEYINEGEEPKYDGYRLLCFTKWGSQCLNQEFDTLNKAVSEGRKMKKDEYAFSYQVYGLFEKEGKRKRRLLKQG